MAKNRIATALAFVLCAFTAYAANAMPRAPADDPPEEDLRLFEVVLDEYVLSEALAGYPSPGGGTMLPLGAMSELLGIAITAEPQEGLATGFVLNEGRTFHLDVARRQATVAGKAMRFEDELVRLYGDDIYVDSSLLSDWIPVAFDIDLFSLRIRVRPREPLPLQLRLDRERRIRHWRVGLPPPDPGYPRIRTAFRLWQTPFIDQTLRLALGSDRADVSYSTYATGDLLFMESETYLSGNDGDPFDIARITLRRRDPSGSLGGVLRATEIAAGHVIFPGSSLLAHTSEPAPGVVLSNLPLHRPAEFDRHTFRGNLPTGWDVELYHNGALIDYEPSRPDGQYVFEDVPILFGMNFFRLVFHGPQGQRRHEDYRFLLGASLTLPGRFEYRVVANAESEAQRRGSMLLSYGVSRNLTTVAEVASLPTSFGERRYARGGLRGSWSAMFTYGDYITDDVGASAWEAGLQTRLFGTNVLFSRAALSSDFVSEMFPADRDRLQTHDRLRIDTAIPAWILPRIAVSFDASRQQFYSGNSRTFVENRLSTNYKGLALSHRMRWTADDEIPSRLEGALRVSRYIRRVGVRGELLYTVAPDALSAANLTFERYLAGNYRLYANITRSFLSESQVYSIGIAKVAGSFAAGIETVSTPDGNIGANLSLSAGLGYEPREGDWISDARSKAPLGALSARVFLDRNYNGLFDAGDEPLPDVGFTVNGVERPQRTSSSGIAFVPDVAAHQATDVAVDTLTLEDSMWVSDLRGIRIVPRPGNAAVLDFAIVETAEIEGTVYQTRAGRREPAGGVTVSLIATNGDVVQTTKAAYDGFYLFTQVRPGTYTLRVPTDVAPLEQAVTVKRGESVLVASDFDITRPSPREPAVVAESAPPPSLPEVRADAPSPEQPRVRATGSGRYALQLGTFSVRANAEKLIDSVRDIAPDAAVVAGGRYHVVRTGAMTRAHAAGLQRTLSNRGVEAMIVRASGSAVNDADVAPPRLPMPADRPSANDVSVQLGTFSLPENARHLADATRDLAPTVEVADIGRYHVVRATVAGEAEAALLLQKLRARGVDAIIARSGDAPERKADPAESRAFVVQLGAFSSPANADDLARTLARRGLDTRASVSRRGSLYFVETGPFSTREDAAAARDALRRAGVDALVRQRPDQPR